MSNAGTRFGPEPFHYDPFDAMTDDELDAELDELVRREPPSVTISIRMPADLLGRTKRAAAAGGVPYQTLIKRLVDAGVSRLEQRAKR
ncbi:MAG TPA: CopG family antitoxin [Chloroflexota bacterium]|nr:CopG family antitoxin [Chloroflexota bacterium]